MGTGYLGHNFIFYALLLSILLGYLAYLGLCGIMWTRSFLQPSENYEYLFRLSTRIEKKEKKPHPRKLDLQGKFPFKLPIEM